MDTRNAEVLRAAPKVHDHQLARRAHLEHEGALCLAERRMTD